MKDVIAIGSIVDYTLTESDAIVSNRRGCADGGGQRMGRAHAAGDIVPLVVVRLLGPAVLSGQALVDGNFSLWISRTGFGFGPGFWRQRAAEA